MKKTKKVVGVHHRIFSGNLIDLMYDANVSKLDVSVREIAGVPCIVFEDASHEESRDLFVMHIKEAIELKSVIDTLVLDWQWTKMEKEK